MLRLFVCFAVAFALSAGFGLAADPDKKAKKKAAKLAAAPVSGEIVKVDVEKAALTLKVPGKRKKQPAEEKEFKVTLATTVTAVEGEKKTELKAESVADMLRKDQFKVGAAVNVEPGQDGAAKSITFGAAPVTPKKKKVAK